MRLLHSFSSLVFGTAVAAALTFSIGAHATSFTNGGFETITVPGASNQLGFHTQNSVIIQDAAGWTNNSVAGVLGYNFVMSGSTVSGTTYGDAFGSGFGLSFWAVAGGLSNGIGPSPDGGNFLALDGAYQQATVSQTITGLIVGKAAQVSFYYAGAQQSGFDGATSEGFEVTFGSEVFTTPILTNVDHGFTGWHYITLEFTPTSTTETLSFLALGTPNGLPPFSLLDGVSVVQVTPEPSSLALLGTGVLCVGGLLRRRFAKR